jgi:hypothetical protein
MALTLEDLALRLKAPDPTDNDLFRDLIMESMSLLEIDDHWLGQLLHISGPTAQRWISGLSAPYTNMRLEVYHKLHEAVQERLKHVQERKADL